MKRLVPDGLRVVSAVYGDHFIFGSVICVALFAVGYVLHI